MRFVHKKSGANVLSGRACYDLLKIIKMCESQQFPLTPAPGVEDENASARVSEVSVVLWL